MSKPVLLSLGEKLSVEPRPAIAPDAPEAEVSAPPPAVAASPSGESLAEVYEVLKRHQETLRDLIVEVRLLYYNLPDKEKQRLEALRERTTREVGDLFAGQIHSLDETIARLRGK